MGRYIQKIIQILLSFGILLGVVSCSSDPQSSEINYVGIREPYEEPATDYDESLFFKVGNVDILKIMNKASLNIFNNVIEETGGRENFCVSTFCVNSMLASLMKDSAPEVQEEILDYFNYIDPEVIRSSYSIFCSNLPVLDNQVDFGVSNSFWIEDKDEFPFLSYINSPEFGTELKKVSFGTLGAKDSINLWFKENTRGGIVEFLKNSPDGSISLSSAGYVKGKWNTSFDRESMGMFQGVTGSTEVEMMHIKDRWLGYAEGENWQGVILSFGNVHYIMRVILPDEGVEIKDVKGLEDAVWVPCRYVDVSIPKFKYEYKNENFKSILQRSGISKIFTPNGWNSKEVTKVKDAFCIDNWMLGSGITVDGTVAKPASNSMEAIGLPILYYPPVESIDKDVELIFDRPFIYQIREHCTNTILFMGVVNNL